MRFPLPKNLTPALILFLSLLAPSAFVHAAPSPVQPPTTALTSRSPLFFEALPLESTQHFRFVSRGERYLFGIAPTEAQIVLQKSSVPASEASAGRSRIASPRDLSTRSVRTIFVGANPAARASGDSELAGKINYFIGDDPAQWRFGVPTFSKVRVDELYPGVSLVYYGNQQRLEYDFNIAPGADAAAIVLRFDGSDSLRIDEQGGLVIRLGEDEIRQPRPEVYQVANGSRRSIEGGYQLKDSRTVRFALGAYDKALPLVIDPTLSYSTFFGGNFADQAYAVKVDTNGFVYVAGETLSTTFLFSSGYTNGFSNSFRGGKSNGDAFVAKFDNTASGPPLYFSYLGGSGEEAALDIAVDSAQRAYITGFTDSSNFPTSLPADALRLTNRISGVSDPIVHVFPTDVFVAEFDTRTNGPSSLIYSTYLGGDLGDSGIGIALDQNMNAYVTGYTLSSNFPIYHAYQTNYSGSNDVFVAKIGAGGHGGLLYSSYLGGTNVDEGQGIAVAAPDIVFITGYTASTNFPLSHALQPEINRSTNMVVQYNKKFVPLDAFIAEFDTSLIGTNSFLYCSYFGGSNSDAGYRITLDASTNVYITGNTTSLDFPDTSNHVALASGITNSFNYDAILAKFAFGGPNPSMPLSLRFGGAFHDVGWDLALDPVGDIFIVGVTASTNFPTANTIGFLRATNSGANDAFVMGFAPDASNLLYSAYFGGDLNDFGYGIAVDGAGSAYIVGFTYSTNFPVMSLAPPPAAPIQARINGTNDTFLAKISLRDISLARLPAPGAFKLAWPFSPEFVLQTKTNLTILPLWTDVTASPVLSNGWNTLTLQPTNPAAFFRLKR